MEEAVEICKLRLFLKLVAQVEKVKDLEPLPDIDFNIRAGNTLVGFTTVAEIRRAAELETPKVQGSASKQILMVSDQAEKAIRRIEEEAEVVERAFCKFHKMQSAHEMNARELAAAKMELRDRLKKLTQELNSYLAREYHIDSRNTQTYEKWRESHQPFHWFAEFYGIMHRGGFDVVIGNPPYVVYTPSKVSYSLEEMKYQTLSAKNLYAYVFERAISLVKNFSPIGLIVQLTVLSSGKMAKLQDILLSRWPLYALPFPRRPLSMFDGVEMPVAILISGRGSQEQYITSRIGRIYSEERPFALHLINLNPHSIRVNNCRIAKIGCSIELEIYRKISSQKLKVQNLITSRSGHVVYYQEACRYWLKACVGRPYFRRNGKEIPPPHGRFIILKSAQAAAFVGCLLNSSLFYWYYSILSDCDHVNDELVKLMPIPNEWSESFWNKLVGQLSRSLELNATRKVIRTKEGHEIEYDEMKAMLSKDVIDSIDKALAILYSFTGAELDFIINYDSKYRARADLESG